MSAIDPLPVDDRPSLKSFQDSVEEQHRSARIAAISAGDASSADDELAEGVEGLAVEDTVPEDDGRPVKVRYPFLRARTETSKKKSTHLHCTQDRLINATEQDIMALAGILDRTLDRRAGEVILHVSASTLSSTTLCSICDALDAKSPLSFDTVVLPLADVNAILATCKKAAAATVEVTLLHNPFDNDGRLKRDEGVKLTQSPSAVNDEETQQRWRSKALRILVRKKPEGAEQLLETRVAVVGNVVRLFSAFASPLHHSIERSLTTSFVPFFLPIGCWKVVFTRRPHPRPSRRRSRQGSRRPLPPQARDRDRPYLFRR